MTARRGHGRAVVVGAGIGGLSAAIRLALRGLDVTIVEADERPGGKAGTADRDGVRFDTGPSVVTMPEVFDDLFRAAGVAPSDFFERIAPTPAFRYRWEDGVVLDVSHALDETLENVDRTLGASARRELEHFLTYARRIWDAAAPAFVMGPPPSLGSIAALGVGGLRDVLRIDALRTMRGAIRSRVREPHLRDVLLRYATYNGSDPRVAPATLNCIAWVELGLGGWGIRGGIGALVDALAELARELGVVIELGRRVAAIDVDGAAARGVQLEDGTHHAADVVVANADVATVATRLLPPGAAPELKAATRAAPSTSGHTVVLRAARSEARAAHTVVFPSRYDAEFEDLFDARRPPVSPTVYACDQSLAHGIEGWTDGVPVFVMANAPARREADSGADDAESLEAALLGRARAAGVIAPDDAVVWRRGVAGLAAQFPDTGGALYGAASNGPWSAFRRPGNAVRSVRGLFLASGSAHPGGGLPLCALSGKRAAELALEHVAATTDARLS